MIKKEIEQLIYESFDRSLSQKEGLILREALRSSKELRTLQKQIGAIRRTVSEIPKSEFKPFFETRMMGILKNRSGQPAGIAELITLSFSRVAIAASIVLVILTTYNIQMGTSGLKNNLLGYSKPNIENAFDPTLQFIQK
ncbi:MAG: hypothetical protein WCJ01_03540 [Ignavibacteria bacterium]